MSHPHIACFRVTLTLKAPFISHAVGALGLGWDTALHRDDKGRPALPGSLVKGNLRESWEYFESLPATAAAEKPSAGHWLGHPAAMQDWMPQRSRLIFDYWWSDLEWCDEQQADTYYRVAIDEDSGAAVTGAIQMIESPYPAGHEVKLQGKVRAWCKDNKEAVELRGWLQRGLDFTAGLGALKGVGFGRLLHVSVQYEPESRQPPEWPAATSKTVGLRLRLDRPLCFVRNVTGERNRMVSEDFIPGAALIGAIGQCLDWSPGNWPTVEAHLHELRCTHARPADRSDRKRSIVPPLSLTVDGENGLYDLALRAEEDAPLLKGQAPAFQPDWKERHWDKAAALCGIVSPPRRLDVRTAIDRERGAARDEALFSMETVMTQNHDWLANLDLSRIPDTCLEDFKNELQELLGLGLAGLGKTNACVEAALEPPYSLAVEEEGVLKDGLAIITLLTPARLLPGLKKGIPPTNGNADLKKAYAKTWEKLSGGVLEMVDYFARQTMQGGRYWWGRYGSKHGRDYFPEIHTAAGSVFILKPAPGSEARASEKLADWREHGLPQPDGLEKWDENPWIRNNGYGEIAVNLNLHWSCAAQEEKR